MKKQLLTFSLASAIISLPALAGNMRSSTTTETDDYGNVRETSKTQERMEDGTRKTSTEVRKPASETGSSVRKSKETTRRVERDEYHDED